jgi:hypothetical protein
MGEGYKLVRVAGGASSIHSVVERETFHPVIGPSAEAEALYVRQVRLIERVQSCDGEFVIWDVGLGGAANALAVLRATRHIECKLRLVSFDRTLDPLEFALGNRDALAYPQGYEGLLRELSQTGSVAFGDGGQTARWELHLGDFPTLIEQACSADLPKPHTIMFDPFSPARNPAMWTLPLFRRVFELLDPHRHCLMPTYSRSTMLRVTWLLAGFFVGTGHATGEKEETTIAANSIDLIERPLDRRWLGRARRSTSAEPLRDAAYRQAGMSQDTWDRLLAHPQFV